ncbi:MAG TPA: hypothetical protein VMZ92_06180 [Planctomycetota bacterium]|nr:hypothetical protein [Planctomycetota bacterium]
MLTLKVLVSGPLGLVILLLSFLPLELTDALPQPIRSEVQMVQLLRLIEQIIATQGGWIDEEPSAQAGLAPGPQDEP